MENIINYFKNVWRNNNHSNFENYYYSGYTLCEKIDDNELVLDVGCGLNHFKGKLNVIGIDPAFTEADYMVTLDEFEHIELFDVILCLGSINFGDDEIIDKQFIKLKSLLKPKGRIYFRFNKGNHDHGNPEFEQINVYPWDVDRLIEKCSAVGFKILDTKNDWNNRLYAEVIND